MGGNYFLCIEALKEILGSASLHILFVYFVLLSTTEKFDLVFYQVLPQTLENHYTY